MFKKTRALLLLGPLAFLANACMVETSDGGAEVVGAKADQLYLTGLPGKLKWPNGVVPVCFTSASQSVANFALNVRRVREAAYNSWPTAAKVEFTGWGICPANTNGMLAITLTESGGNNSDCGYNASRATPMNLNVNDSRFTHQVVPHEFGHALGFEHEFQRQDYDLNMGCEGLDAKIPGDTLGTPQDKDSLLLSTYCNMTIRMSAWDAFGVIKAYGRRVNAVRPLVTGWSAARTEHATAATDAAIQNAESASYTWSYAPGWTFTSQLPGTVPLKMYWSNARQDNVTLASADTQADVVAAGYTLFSTEGYVFSASQPGTVPLKQYWSNARLDHMLVTPGPAEIAAQNAGYSFVRIEGYVPSTIPYSLLWSFWSNARLDNAVSKQASRLSQDLGDASYEFAGIDGAVWNEAYPGTSQLRNYWSNDRSDHFALATTASQTAAVSAGYTLVLSENQTSAVSNEDQPDVGYLHNTAVTGLSPMNSYWSANRTEHFTTIGKGSVATSQGYALVRTEGWGLATN